MLCETQSPFLQLLRGRVNLEDIPFTERGSRLLVFKRDSHLYIKLAERWAQWEGQVGHYRLRAPLIDDLIFTDGDGALLPLTLVSFPHALGFETPEGFFEMTFVDEDTLLVHLPRSRVGIRFCVYAERGRTDRRGGEFKGDPLHRSTHRNVAYSTNARILANTIEPDAKDYLRVSLDLDAREGGELLLNITPRLGFNRSIPYAEETFAKAEKRWHAWFAVAPRVNERFAHQYYYAWYVLRAGLLSTRYFLTREAMAPSILHYVGVWQWDAFFHALAYRHVDAKLAEDQLRILIDHQREDGMIPDVVHDEGVITHLQEPVDADVTKPPLIAWAALKLYRTSGHRDFLAEIYEPVVRWNAWWFEKNDDTRDGIVQYNHPFSSGLDDSPLWDEGMPVESPDLNTYLVLQLDSLAEMADILGERADAQHWRAQADELVQRIIAHFWDSEAGVFWARRNEQPIRVLTPFNIYPLLTCRLPRAMNDRLIAQLLAPEKFWTRFPIPTVARGDPKYNPNQMWRGPTWVNINYLFIDGLERCGYAALARKLRERTLELLMAHDDLFEYYHPETGEPPPSAARLFGWSSAIFIDLAIRASQDGIEQAQGDSQ